jgi:hypothetical protein
MIKSGERRVDSRQQEGEFVRIPHAEMSLYPVPPAPMKKRR